MKNLSLVFLFLASFLLTPKVQAQQAGLGAQTFNEAIAAYQAKDYKKAQLQLQEILKTEPRNPVILTNLALTEFQLGQRFLALGLIRKALYWDPSLETARLANNFIASQVLGPSSGSTFSIYEKIRKSFLSPIPTVTYFALSALCLFFTGWILISYIERRKKSKLSESALPPFPWIGTVIGLLFTVFISLFLMKIYDQNQVRGTIVTDQVALQTAPGDNQVSIQDILGGEEVKILAEKEDWVQVRPLGKPAGWIKKSVILMTH